LYVITDNYVILSLLYKHAAYCCNSRKRDHIKTEEAKGRWRGGYRWSDVCEL